MSFCTDINLSIFYNNYHLFVIHQLHNPSVDSGGAAEFVMVVHSPVSKGSGDGSGSMATLPAMLANGSTLLCLHRFGGGGGCQVLNQTTFTTHSSCSSRTATHDNSTFPGTLLGTS